MQSGSEVAGGGGRGARGSTGLRLASGVRMAECSLQGEEAAGMASGHLGLRHVGAGWVGAGVSLWRVERWVEGRSESTEDRGLEG